MSYFFRPADSSYLGKTTTDLKAFRQKGKPTTDELYACSPLDSPDFKDERTIDVLLKCIDKSKLDVQLQKIQQSTESTEAPVFITIACGSFGPIHKSHIQMQKAAILRLHQEGWNVAMGYFLPMNPVYTAKKLEKLLKHGDNMPTYLDKKHIDGSLKATFADEPQLDACLIDLYRVSYSEWYVGAQELMNMLRYMYPKTNFKFAIVGGEDLIRSNGQLHKGIKVVDFADMIMMMPRGMDEEKRKKFPIADDVKILEESDKDRSSTNVRKYLKEKNTAELEKHLHPNTIKYLLSI